MQAPELLLSPTSYDGKAADVWACGVLLFTLLTGAHGCVRVHSVFREATADNKQRCESCWVFDVHNANTAGKFSEAFK